MTIQRRPTSKGTAYIVRWRYNGLSKSKSFSRLAEAREYDAAMQHSLHVQTYVDPRAGKTILADFAEVWLGSHAVSAATKAKYRSLLNAQINPALGSLPLDQVTPLRIRQFLANTGKAPSTVRSLAALLSSISLAAVEDEKIRKTFMPSRLALPPERVQERVFLSVAQVAELVEAADDRNKALIHTAAWTGLRWGELVGLRRERLDLERGAIEVREALVDVAGELTLAPPKTPHSHRTVRLDQRTVEVLRNHVATYAVGQCELIFTTERRRPIRDDNWRKRVWRPLVTSVASVPDGTRFHDLRHTHVALAIQAGLNLKSIQTRLGHSSVRVTGDVYAHLLQAVEDREVVALEALAESGGILVGSPTQRLLKRHPSREVPAP